MLFFQKDAISAKNTKLHILLTSKINIERSKASHVIWI
jgi:hypothetical protein